MSEKKSAVQVEWEPCGAMQEFPAGSFLTCDLKTGHAEAHCARYHNGQRYRMKTWRDEVI